jgi:kynurenine formamidase
MNKIKDITVAFRPDLQLWLGDPAPSLSLMKNQEGSDSCNVTCLNTGVHFGIHLHAPSHFIRVVKRLRS